MNTTRIQWAGEYLRQAIADEIELAQVKLRHRVRMPTDLSAVMELYPDPPRGNSPFARHSRTTIGQALPRWRRSWSAAGPLATELGLAIRHDAEEGAVSVGTGSRRRDVTEAYSDHPDRDAATMAAIVRAAIRFCTEAREST